MDQDLIKRYLRNECSPQEREEVKALMKTGEAKRLFDQALNEHWSEEIEEATKEQLSDWKNKFQLRVNEEQQELRIFRNPNWLKYAAVLVMVMSIFAGYTIFKSPKPVETVIAMREAVNTNGKLLKVILNDSSVITLNAGTKLRYPASFNGRTREVYLEGEAFFDIAHDPLHPFVVHSSKLKVSVLGTSFNVKAYPLDQTALVSVASGKVGVLSNSNGNQPYMLLPGDKISFDRDQKIAVRSHIDLNEIAAWQSGTFVFRDESLENICRELERWYNVKIIFKKDQVRKMRLNFKQKNDRIENVMKTLKFAAGINYKISDQTIFIN